MTVDRNSISTALGFCLLPSELLEDIFLRLALPEILRLKSVSRNLNTFISRDDFRRIYDYRSTSETWIFLFKKRFPRDSVLHGFSDRSGRWFKIPIARAFFHVVNPGEDLYFLTASGDFFLFASNYHRELIALNLMKNTVKRIPSSPLGPRGTSSWRRSGLKLIAGPPGSDTFLFLFAELYQNRPFLFRYSSETDTWQSTEAVDANVHSHTVNGDKKAVVLSVIHRRGDSMMLSIDPHGDRPAVYRPRFDGGAEEALAVGLVSGSSPDRLHVYGDGKMVVVRSDGENVVTGGRVFRCVEVWGLTADGGGWEFVSRVPERLLETIKKPYGAMMGCLEERDGVVRVVLLSNYKGSWDIIWLSYGVVSGEWRWVPLPDCGTKELNMAGIAISSGLRLLSSRY
ncbi:uncharacterized protein [Aristolochia californica]|uniref:uncharacterized protein n=1 Tax=Aristolochia californica TaxID=171875 RepID=UPI0035DFF947